MGEIDMNRLGAVVGFERADGSMGLSSWFDPTVIVWTVYDCDPDTLSISRLREHMIRAYPISEIRPEPIARKAICFKRPSTQEPTP